MNADARKSPSSLVNSLFLLTLPLLAYVGAIGFGTVWLRHQISVTANANKKLESQIAETQRGEAELAAEIAQAQTTGELLRKNVSLGINLVQPRPEQVLTAKDDVERLLAAKRFGSYVTSAESSGVANAGDPRH